MRMIAMYLALAAVASAGCLRSTAFRCASDTECGASGACEANGFCSFPNASCEGTGRSFSDTAGPELANTCVPGGTLPPIDAGMNPPDAPIDGPSVGCPSGYTPVAGSPHRYKVLAAISWDTAASSCKATSASAYLAVPDDATELANLATAAGATPFWLGIDDKAVQNNFVSQAGGMATFLPWAPGEPDHGPPAKECVVGISSTQIATEKCGTAHVAVCECVPQ